MRRLLYLATLSMLFMMVLAPTALAQTVETVPLNPDGACPEGFVTVNAPFCAQESPNTPGRIFGYGEGDLAPATAQYDQYTPAADQYAAPADTAALPATGGPALLLSAGVLLLGAGLLGMKLTRRS